MVSCNNCESSEWTKVYEKEYDGHKGSDKRKERIREVFKCDGCGAEGRKFSGGVGGTTTYSGAMR